MLYFEWYNKHIKKFKGRAKHESTQIHFKHGHRNDSSDIAQSDRLVL